MSSRKNGEVLNKKGILGSWTNTKKKIIILRKIIGIDKNKKMLAIFQNEIFSRYEPSQQCTGSDGSVMQHIRAVMCEQAN
jgi:hypothetical protein